MNSDAPKSPREELELRITALLLGELPADEAAAVREAIAKDAELTKLHDDLKQTIVLVREASSIKESAAPQTEPLKLSETRRQKLLTAFTIPPLKEKDRKPGRSFRVTLIEVLVVVSLVAIVAAMFLPSLGKAKSKAQHVTVLSTLRQLDGAKQQWAMEHNKSADAEPTIDDIRPYLGRGGDRNLPTQAGEKYIVGKVGESPSAVMEADKSKSWFGDFKEPTEPVRRITLPGRDSFAAANQNSPGNDIALVTPNRNVERAVSRDGKLGDDAYDSSVRPATAPVPSPVMQPQGGSQINFQNTAREVMPASPPVAAKIELPALATVEPGATAGFDLPARPELEVRQIVQDPSVVASGGGGGGARGDNNGIGTTLPSSGYAHSVNLRGARALDETMTASSAVPESDGIAGIPRPQKSSRVLALETIDPVTGASVNGKKDAAVYDSKVVGYAGGPILVKSFGAAAATESVGDVIASTTAPAHQFGEIQDSSAVAGRVLDRFYRVEPQTGSPAKKKLSVDAPTAEGRERFVISGRVGGDDLEAKLQEQRLPIDAKSRAYLDQKRKVDELKQFASVLERKINYENISVDLPKTAQVKILERATTNSTPARGIVGGLRSLLSSESESTARVVLNRDASDIPSLGKEPRPTYYDPYVIQSESKVITSEVVLSNAVNALNLREKWGKKYNAGQNLNMPEALRILRAKLDISPVKETGVMEIRAKDSDPAEAAKLANAVAQAYCEYRLADARQLALSGINALQKKTAEQNRAIEEAEKELKRLEKELKAEDTDLPVRQRSTNTLIPQPEIQTSENNFSTFSLNVSDVSFKLAAASLEQGQLPDAASIRSEEFINAFDYRDPEPVAGAPIAFAWERARYPFAHNRDLLRFSLKTAAAGRQAGRPLNIVLLLDNSGSMERSDRVRIIREALRVLASQLQAQDKLSVITFARTARLVADGISGDKAGEVAEQVSGLAPQGGTNLEDAMNLAYQTAARHYLASGINRVVLLTDGAANLGDVEPASLKHKVEAQRQQGIALDCFGIGWEGFNDDLLEVLSRNGDGRYGFINSPEEAATDFAGQLAGALKVAASDVKVQVEFNPNRVTAYRQIGYAKHQLTKEQFRDNTVDAAEIAAQEAGNALYTVEVNPVGAGPLATVRVRYKVPGTTDYREQAWDVPYTGNAVLLEQASPALRLAASASAFSEWLVASPFAGEVTPGALLGFLRGVPEIYGADARPKKLEWMIRQAKSVSGK